MNIAPRTLVHTALAAFLILPSGAHAEQMWTEIEEDAYLVDTLNMTAGELEGISLLGPEGEAVGTLGRVMMEQGGDSVVASVDLGEKEVLVPIYELAASPEGVSIEMTTEQLVALPEYEG